MNDDATLLCEYAGTRSEAAFTELVRRHVDLVYATALRRTDGDSHLAADVSQQVFTELARRAEQLSGYASLGAWLHTATRNAAINLMISEKRRRVRETAALAAAEDSAPAGAATDWDRVRPVLDAAIDELPEQDRTAIVLRFLERQTFAAIGGALRVSEDAARMRTGCGPIVRSTGSAPVSPGADSPPARRPLPRWSAGSRSYRPPPA